jgi:transcriptional regulator with XRE-family HTH domain
MDNIELGNLIKSVRKNELRMTQLEFMKRTEMDIKKISRLECGYQYPDDSYWQAVDRLGLNSERIAQLRQATDDARHTTVIKRSAQSVNTEMMAEDLRMVREIVARNNLMLRDIIKRMDNEEEESDLMKAALAPIKTKR